MFASRSWLVAEVTDDAEELPAALTGNVLGRSYLAQLVTPF